MYYIYGSVRAISTYRVYQLYGYSPIPWEGVEHVAWGGGYSPFQNEALFMVQP